MLGRFIDGRWIRPEATPAAAPSGRIDLTVNEWYGVFEWYGLTCHLCGEAINDRLTFPHDLSPSADHLVPVSRGGTNALANLRPAHLVCNSRRSNLALRGKVRATPEVSSESLFDALLNQKKILIEGALWMPVLNKPIAWWRLHRCRVSRFLLRHKRWSFAIASLLEIAILTYIAAHTHVTTTSSWILTILFVSTPFIGRGLMELWANPHSLARGRIMGWDFEEAGDEGPSATL